MEIVHIEEYRNLARNIAKYRKKAGLTQVGLAMKANISRGYLSQIEAKNVGRAPSLDMLFNIANILGVPVYKLFISDDKE
ncbi:MAG: helix-turn-helix domain-containing protein [Firmicutes bacterium]|nr:helix-turn-helix domain-containing protein [Bacillota bacterium]